MPETRYVEQYQNAVLVSRVPYEVSDAELAEEADQKDLLAKIDLISTLTHAQLAVVVERMAKRLVNKGLLP